MGGKGLKLHRAWREGRERERENGTMCSCTHHGSSNHNWVSYAKNVSYAQLVHPLLLHLQEQGFPRGPSHTVQSCILSSPSYSDMYVHRYTATAKACMFTYCAYISDSGPISTIQRPSNVFLPTMEWAWGTGGSESDTRDTITRALPLYPTN